MELANTRKNNITNKNIKKLLRILSIIPLLFAMITIWGFSNSNADESSSVSLVVTEKIVNGCIFLSGENITDEKKTIYIEKIHTPVRKIAHATEYATLAVTAFAFIYFNLFNQDNNINHKKTKRIFLINDINKVYIITITFCLIYATSDEIHQIFIPGRACRILDIVIDTVGAYFGMTLIFFINKTRKSMKKHIIFNCR